MSTRKAATLIVVLSVTQYVCANRQCDAVDVALPDWADKKWVEQIEQELGLGKHAKAKPAGQADPQHQAKLADLRRKQCQTLAQLFDVALSEYDSGQRSLNVLLELAERLRKAELASELEPGKRIALLDKQLARLKRIESQQTAKSKKVERPFDQLLLQTAQLDLQIVMHQDQFGDFKSSAEQRVLKERAQMLEITFKQYFSLHIVGARGGEPSRVASIGRDWQVACAELALASGDKKTAIARYRRALEYSDWRRKQTEWGHTVEEGDEAISTRLEHYRIESELARLCPSCLPEDPKPSR